jgi:hypothetical protein
MRARQRSGMRWDERLEHLFDDLEQQAEGLVLADRDAEVAEQSRAEYAQVDLAGRLHASAGRLLTVAVTGVGTVEARLARAGEGWCLLDVGRQEWIVPLPAIGSVRGLADRAEPPEVRPVTSRLGLSSALRGVADSRASAVLHGRDGSLTRGVLDRVGADFVEVRVGEGLAGYRLAVPFGALAAVCSG